MTCNFSSLPVRLAACLCLPFFLAGPVQGELLPRYDLDSLIYLSSCIIAGEISRPYSSAHQGGTVVEVRERLHVRSLVKSTCPAAGTITVHGLNLYRGRPEVQAFHGDPRDRRAGDSLLLFLKTTSETDTPAPGSWQPVPSGVRVLWGERYYAFEQFRNPGPYVLTAHRAAAVKYLDFRKRLKVGLKRNRALKNILARTKEVKDARLFDYLRKRLRRPRPHGPLSYSHRDRIAEGLCRALAVRDEPALTARALRLKPDYHCSDVLIRGLITPRGREFALARLGRSNSTPLERRRWSRILEFLGDDYYSRYVFGARAGGFRKSPRPDNGRFVTRMAETALQNASRPHVSGTLVRIIASFARGRGGTRRAVRTDTIRALGVLRKLHDAVSDSTRRFYVQEIICRASAFECRKLTGLGQPVLSLIGNVRGGVNTTGDDFTLDRRLRADELMLDYRIVFLTRERTDARMGLILVSADGRRTHRLPMHAPLPAGDTITGTTRVQLPRNLQAGAYRVYLRVTLNRRAGGPAHPASFVRGRDLSFNFSNP